MSDLTLTRERIDEIVAGKWVPPLRNGEILALCALALKGIDTSAAAPQPAQVAVKPLEWSEFRSDDNVLFMQASGLGVRYEVFHKASDAATGVQVARYLRADPTDDDEIVEVIGYGRDLAGAYAIAQADYEPRIRSALAPSPADGAVEAPNPPVADPSALTPLQVKLLESGARYKWIWLSDDAAWHTSEVVALGELRRAGLVEFDPGPFPPGPPAPAPSRITEAGRKALATLKGDTP